MTLHKLLPQASSSLVSLKYLSEAKIAGCGLAKKKKQQQQKKKKNKKQVNSPNSRQFMKLQSCYESKINELAETKTLSWAHTARSLHIAPYHLD